MAGDYFGFDRTAQRFRNLETGRFVSDSVSACPPFVLNDVTNGRFAHPVELAQSPVIAASPGEKSPDLSNLILSKFGRTRLFPELPHALIEHVGNVLGVSSREQMVRAHARRVVTAMTNKQADPYGPEVEGIGELMSAGAPFTSASKRDVTIAVHATGTRPYPTLAEAVADGRTVLVNLFPEAVFNRAAKAESSAKRTAIRECRTGNERSAASAWLGRLTAHRDDLPVSRGAKLPDVGASREHFDAMIIPALPGVDHG